MPAGEAAAAGGFGATKALLASVAIRVLVAGGVTAGLVFGLGDSPPPPGNTTESPFKTVTPQPQTGTPSVTTTTPTTTTTTTLRTTTTTRNATADAIAIE